MYSTLIGLLGFGFLLGLKHAFDTDHIAAVSAISKNTSIKKSSLSGVFWGLGHAISLLVIGFIVLLFKIRIPEKLGLSLELIVGVMLVILGLNVLITVNKNKAHFHKHKHGKEEHMHFHSHLITEKHGHNHQSFFIGLVHGLAGSAALTLLILTTIDSLFAGVTYILIFGIGSIIGMVLVSNLVSLPFRLISKKLEISHKILRLGTSFISIILGLSIMYKTMLIF